MKKTVLMFDDNDNLRKSIASMLEWNDDFGLAAALPNANAAVENVKKYRPDVVLMDIDMPGTSGVEALKRIRAGDPELPVIMLTVFEENEYILDAICSGASGYLLKKNFDQLIPAIKDVLNGGAPMTSSIAKKVLTLFPKTKSQQQTPVENVLSEKENEVLQLLIRGNSYKMIAAEMGIAVETVRSHIKKVYRKLQVNSATEAIYKVNAIKG